MAKTDTIKFALAAERTVVNDTVKIIADIAVGMVKPDSSEAALYESIRQMMGRFIATQWQYSGMRRETHDSGLESVYLVATARVPESENRALEARRREVSSPGLAISRVRTDLSFPASLVQQTEQQLRLDLAANAAQVCAELSEAMGQQYRVGRIAYGTPDSGQNLYANNMRASVSAASMKTAYGAGFGPDSAEGEDGLGNAQKFTMTASVTLRV